MKPWGTPAFTGYFCEDFTSTITLSRLLLRKEEIRIKYLTWNSLKFVKKTSMLNPVKSIGYIKCYSSSSPKPVKSPGNSIRYNCEKICSCSRRTKTILGIRKKATFLQMMKNPIIYKFLKDFTNPSKNNNWAVAFGCIFFPNILKYSDHRCDLPKIWKTRFFQTNIEELS